MNGERCLFCTKKNKKLEVINYLRGFAIFTIVLMHCVQGYLGGVLHKAASLGGAGEHVFILCSGFGLYLSYLNKPLGYKDFLKKRFGKVYFPYVIVIALYALWGITVVGGVNWNAVASHVFLYKMFDSELDICLLTSYAVALLFSRLYKKLSIIKK